MLYIFFILNDVFSVLLFSFFFCFDFRFEFHLFTQEWQKNYFKFIVYTLNEIKSWSINVQKWIRNEK